MTAKLGTLELMVMGLTKPMCLDILQDLPTVCPPRPTRQTVKELRRAIHSAWSAGGAVGEKASDLVWGACDRRRDAMDNTEIQLQAMLNKLKKNAEEKDGPGAFEHGVRRGQLLMSKKEHELTDEERAFLCSPVPAKQH